MIKYNFFFLRCTNSVLESHNIGYAQKSVVNKLQLPLKPKKPSPPFFQYLKERRQEVIEKHNLNFKGKYFYLFYLFIAVLHLFKYWMITNI